MLVAMADRWWRHLAIVVATLVALLGVANAFDDEGALFGRLGYAAIAIVGVTLVGLGLRVRLRNRSPGDAMVILGLAPGFVMLLMFWFPPVAFVGLAALSAAGLALRDATSGAQDEVSSLA